MKIILGSARQPASTDEDRADAGPRIPHTAATFASFRGSTSFVESAAGTERTGCARATPERAGPACTGQANVVCWPAMKRVAAVIGLLWVPAACDLGGRERDMLREELMARDARVRELEREVDELKQTLATQAAPTCPAPAAPTDPAPAAPTDPAPSSAGPIDVSTIRCAADRCTAPRELRDALLADPAQLARQARIVPVVQDGETRGFKLYGIRASSAAQAFGLRNGDIVTTIGDRAMTSMDAALAMFTGLAGSDEWTIAGERQGAPFRLTITFAGQPAAPSRR